MKKLLFILLLPLIVFGQKETIIHINTDGYPNETRWVLHVDSIYGPILGQVNYGYYTQSNTSYTDTLYIADSLTDISFVIYDSYPVTKGHSLVIPKRQIKEIFELNKEEYESCFELVRKVKDLLITKFKPEGFNIGVNCGEVAGQTIFHAHIHVIPRYKGDVPNPRGGVRNIIPGKGDY